MQPATATGFDEARLAGSRLPPKDGPIRSQAPVSEARPALTGRTWWVFQLSVADVVQTHIHEWPDLLPLPGTRTASGVGARLFRSGHQRQLAWKRPSHCDAGRLRSYSLRSDTPVSAVVGVDGL